MRDLDASKILFLAACAATLLGAAFLFGLYSGARQNAVYHAFASLNRNVVVAAQEALVLATQEPTAFLAPAIYPGAGVTLNDTGSEDFVLLSGFFDDMNEVRLIRRNGDIVQRWPASFHALFPDLSHLPERRRPSTDWNIDLHGALAMPDGSVVFNFEYGGTVRLDRCGKLMWRLAEPTHHSIEPAESGGFWIPSSRWIGPEQETPFPPFRTPIQEDLILRLSDDGVVLDEISVPALFYDNGLESVLTATGEWFDHETVGGEIVHVNKVEELPSDLAGNFAQFEAGDLALSIRDSNLLMVVSPEDRKVKWWQIGPWIRQHDPEFKDGGTIALFNNNLYRAAFGAESPAEMLRVPKVSNIMEVDPATGEVEIRVGKEQNVAFASVIRGKVEVLPNDGFLVTEFQNGRVFEVDAVGKLVWQYINRYDEERTAEVSEARLYPSSYFEVEDWSCS